MAKWPFKSLRIYWVSDKQTSQEFRDKKDQGSNVYQLTKTTMKQNIIFYSLLIMI